MIRRNLDYAETTRRLVLTSLGILNKYSPEEVEKAVKLAVKRETVQKSMAKLPDNHNTPYVKKRADQFRLALDSAVFKIMKAGGARNTVAVPVRGAVKLDGVLDEKFWQEAKLETIESAMLDSRPLQVKSSLRAVVVNDELHLGIECMEPRMSFLKDNLKKRNSRVWDENNLDIFIDPSGNGSYYFQIIVNSLGTLYTGKLVNGKSTLWNGNVRAGAKYFKDRWCVEIAVPLKELANGKEWKNKAWGFNCARVRRTVSPPEYTCWSCTFGKFNMPGRFGKIHFK